MSEVAPIQEEDPLAELTEDELKAMIEQLKKEKDLRRARVNALEN